MPDADLADVTAAAKLAYATNVPNPTIAQIPTALESEVRQRLTTTTVQYRRAQAVIVTPVLG